MTRRKETISQVWPPVPPRCRKGRTGHWGDLAVQLSITIINKRRHDRIHTTSNVQNARYLEELVDCLDLTGIPAFSGVRVVVGEIERQWLIIVVT